MISSQSPSLTAISPNDFNSNVRCQVIKLACFWGCSMDIMMVMCVYGIGQCSLFFWFWFLGVLLLL